MDAAAGAGAFCGCEGGGPCARRRARRTRQTSHQGDGAQKGSAGQSIISRPIHARHALVSDTAWKLGRATATTRTSWLFNTAARDRHSLTSQFGRVKVPLPGRARSVLASGTAPPVRASGTRTTAASRCHDPIWRIAVESLPKRQPGRDQLSQPSNANSFSLYS